MSRFLLAILQPMKNLTGCAPQATTCNSLVKTDNCMFTAIRTKVRCYFPRPNEVKRVRRHGWAYRMSTPNGRRVLMRRLLKGRFVLSH